MKKRQYTVWPTSYTVETDPSSKKSCLVILVPKSSTNKRFWMEDSNRRSDEKNMKRKRLCKEGSRKVTCCGIRSYKTIFIGQLANSYNSNDLAEGSFWNLLDSK